VSQSQSAVALVTGGGSGIGRASALRFADAGYRVAVTDISEAGAASVCAEIGARGGTALAVVADAASEPDSTRTVDSVMAAWGRLDSVVVNAGVQIGGNLDEETSDHWDNILAVNLKGAMYLSRAAVPAIIAGGGGSVVYVASINAVMGFPGMLAYDVSKTGLIALMRNVAVTYGSAGVRANAICPGATLTDYHVRKAAERGMSPDDVRERTKGYALLGRIAEPSEIANVIHFLGSPASSFVTGHVMMADGGLSALGGRG
jgi:NAD(P)-dependent dehydrogenase (short-subunit alcohol dehydrogenase family)